MKTITLDFETYQSELKTSRLEGFEMRRQVVKELHSILDSLNTSDANKFHAAKYMVAKLLTDLALPVEPK